MLRYAKHKARFILGATLGMFLSFSFLAVLFLY